jgi:hypothetical protein
MVLSIFNILPYPRTDREYFRPWLEQKKKEPVTGWVLASAHENVSARPSASNSGGIEGEWRGWMSIRCRGGNVGRLSRAEEIAGVLERSIDSGGALAGAVGELVGFIGAFRRS